MKLKELLATPGGLHGARVVRHLVQVATSVLAACIIALTFIGGLHRGMDHVATFGPETEQTAIAIALSERVYGLNLGYLGYASVLNKLVSVWNVGAKSGHDPILFENNKNRELLNRAIADAASLGPQGVAYVDERGLITTIYDDMGLVDYAKLSFMLFGSRIESFYYTFFALLGLSTLAFTIAFWRDPAAQVVQLATLFAFYVEIHTSIFTPLMPTFAGQRHGSTLALLPVWHFALLLLGRGSVASRPLAAGLALVQLGVFILSIRMRGSAMWGGIFLVGLAIGSALVLWFRTQQHQRSARAFARSIVRWPLVLLIAGVLLQAQYNKMVLHPVYFTDDVIPQHGLWASAYIGLHYSPHLMGGAAETITRAQGPSDRAHQAAAIEYLDRTRFMRPTGDVRIVSPTYISPWTGTIKFRLHDEVMRRVFFEVVRKHPFGVATVYIVKKPIAIIGTLAHLYMNWRVMLLSALGGLMVLVVAVLGGLSSRALLRLAAFTGSAAVLSALPNLWAWPANHTIADLWLVSATSLQLGVAACILLILQWAYRVFTTGGPLPSSTPTVAVQTAPHPTARSSDQLGAQLTEWNAGRSVIPEGQVEISVVIPAFNEAENLPTLLGSLQPELSRYAPFEIIIVDDGSRDGTLPILKKAAAEWDSLRYVSLSRNFGHQAALRAGLAHARGRAIISMDADLQHPIDQVGRMIDRWREGYDVITTCRVDSKTLPLFRRLSSSIYYKTLNFLSDTKLEPGSADFRLLDRKVVDVINGLKENEIVFRAVIPWLGFRTTSIQYTADERLHGTSKYTLRKMISLGMAGIVSTSIMPLRLATVLAGLISGITLVFVIYAFVVYFALGHAVPGWTSTVISINLIGSLQLLVLGVIGEYLGRVLRETRGRPAYVVKETNCQR